MTTVCRVLPDVRGDGPSNMAMDEALLDSVASHGSSAVLRIYEWSVPTLSLGYFQRFEEVEADPRWATVPVVRRPTGGGALWHDQELTYTVVIPSDHPAARPSRSLYRTVHEGIAARLRSMGIPAARRGDLDTAFDGANRPFLCFSDRDSEDVVLQGMKIVGSAQRRRSGAVLQHGSLLLRGSILTPELPGLDDLSQIPRESADWSTLLRSLIPEALGLTALDGDFRIEERQRAASLLEAIYANADWTRRR